MFAHPRGIRMSKQPKIAPEFLRERPVSAPPEQDKALADIASALRLDPHLAEAYELRAQIYMQTENSRWR